MLKTGGSAEHAQTAQRFFKEEIRSYGWRTGDLRRAVVHKRREILKQFDLKFLLQVADNLFNGDINEDKNAAVFLLEDLTDKFGDPEFSLLKSWLPRISNWSDHDALVHYLIGPMIATKPARAKNVFRWAKSPDRWHRRAACVALIQGTRQKMFFPEIGLFHVATHTLPSQLTSGIIRVCHYSAGDFRSKEITVLMIRLARRGARKQPHYRVVVIEKERARNGRPVEVVGTYNPRTSPASVELKRDRVDYWVSKGAKMSDRVSKIVSLPAPASAGSVS